MQENYNAKLVMSKNGRRIAWNQSYSPYGYRLSEVISAMGKEIRRAKEEEAAFWAYQMMISGSEAEDFLWERLKVIAIEDIGLAEPTAINTVSNSEKLYFSLPSKNGDRFMTAIFVVTYLCRCQKTRYANELLFDIKARLQKGTLKPDIPDYALDIHLPHARKKLGRDLYHFLTEGAKLENEAPQFPTIHRERLIAAAKANSIEDKTV